MLVFLLKKSLLVQITSAVSRAILKPVYRFGIPNSSPQMLKIARYGTDYCDIKQEIQEEF